MYVHLRILETPVKRHKQTRHFSSSGGKRSSGIILHLSSFWQLTVVARGGIIFRKLTPTTPLFPSSLNLWEWGFRSRRVSYLQKKSTHVVHSTYVRKDFRRSKQFSKDERCKQRLAPRKTTLKSSPNSSMSPSSSSFATLMFIMSSVRRVCSTWKTISSIFCERAPLIKYCSWKYPFQKALFEIANGYFTIFLWIVSTCYSKAWLAPWFFMGFYCRYIFFRKRSWMTSTCVVHFDIETHVWPQKLGEKRTIRPIKKPLPAPSNVRRAPCIQVWSQCEIYWT